MKAGDRVWYWARRRGERAHIKEGVVRDISASGEFARVDVAGIPTQTVNALRLRTGTPPSRYRSDLRYKPAAPPPTVTPIQTVRINSAKDLENFFDHLFPERPFERASEADVLAGDPFDDPYHPGNKS